MKQFRFFPLEQILLLILILAALTAPGATAVRAESPVAPLAGTTTSIVLTTPSSSANPLVGFGRWSRSITSGWYSVGYNDSAWSTSISAGWASAWNNWGYIPEIGQWALGVDSGGLEYYHRNTFNITIPTGYAIQSGTLQAFCDDSCEMYLNGNAVSAGTISVGVLHAGSNLFAIHQKNSGWWGGLQYRLQVTLYQTDTTGPTVTFTPSTSSWTNGSVSVTATASDPSGVNATYCRFGTTASWTAGSSVCTLSTSVNDNFYSYAVDAVGNTSAVSSYTVTNIDKSAPTLSYTLAPASANGQNGWYTTPVTLILNASDAGAGVDSIYYQVALLGGAPPAPIYTQSVGSTVSLTISQAMAVKWYAVDKVTNQASMQALTINVDQTAPGVAVTPPTPTGNNGWYSGPVTVPVSAIDGNSTGPYQIASWDYRINAGAWTPLTGSAYAVSGSVTISTPGSNVLEVRAVDLAGNQKVASATIPVDPSAPTVSETLPSPTGANGWYNISPIDARLNASDSTSGVDSIYYRVNPVGSIHPDLTYTMISASSYDLPIANGSWIVEWYAVDKAGNLSEVRTFSPKVDAQNPVVSESITPDISASGWYTQPISVNLSATDLPIVLPAQPAIKLEYQLNRGGWQPVTGPITISADAAHELIARATDDAGNQTVDTLNLPVDTTAPSLAISLPTTPKPGWFPKGLNLTANYADATSTIASVQYRVNGGPWQTVTSPISSTDIPMNTEGTFTYDVQVTDKAGLTTTKSTTVSIDATAPVLSETIPTPNGANSWYKTAPVPITLNASDGGAGMGTITYRLIPKGSPAGAYTSVSGGSKTLSIDNGYTTVDWYAQDLVGNASAVRSFVVKVDALSPLVQGAVTPSTQVGGWYPQAITVAITSTDTPVIPSLGENALVEYQLDGAAWQTVDGAVSVSTDGTHTLNMRATDPAGNIATSSLTLKVDTTNPTITVNAPTADGANDWYISSPTISATPADATSGVVSLMYQLDGNAGVSGSQARINSSGTHTLVWIASDNAGHTYTSPVTNIKVDLSDPTLIVTQPAADRGSWYYTQPVKVDVVGQDSESAVSLDAKVDSSSYAPVTGGSISVSGEGQHTLTLRGIDQAGRTVTQTMNIWIDTAPPDITTITPPGQNGDGWYNEPVTFPTPEDLAGSDIVKIEYRLLPDGTFTEVPPSFTESGVYQVEVRLTDEAGHVTLQTITVKVDLDQPTLTVTRSKADGANGWYITVPVTVPFTASDAVSGVGKACYTVDDGDPVCDGNAPALSSAGEHTIAWSVLDHAGNTLTHSETVKIDLTAPVLSTSLPTPEGQDGWFKHQPVTISVSVNDPESGVKKEYQLNGGEWTSFTGDLPISQEGKNQVSIRATNGAGQVTTANYAVKIDTTVPTLDDILPPGTPTDGDGWTGGGPGGTGLVLPGEGGYPGDITLIRYRLLPDGQFSMVPPLLTKSGIYRMEVEITDAAGNVATYTITICLDVDAPVITTNLTGAHNPVKDVVTLTGKIEDQYSGVKSAEVGTDGQNWIPVTLQADGTFTYDYDTKIAANGQHVDLFVRAQDQIGNQSTSTIGLDISNEADKIFIFLPVVLR